MCYATQPLQLYTQKTPILSADSRTTRWELTCVRCTHPPSDGAGWRRHSDVPGVHSPATPPTTTSSRTPPILPPLHAAWPHTANHSTLLSDLPTLKTDKLSYSQLCLKFRCHGNKGQLEVNLNDPVELAVPENHTLESILYTTEVMIIYIQEGRSVLIIH